MSNAVNYAHNGIDEIIRLLSADTIFIPKAILRRDDVYEVSKMLFAVVFTDCLKQTVQGGRTAETISKMMKECVRNMTVSEVQWQCICTEPMAVLAKKEVITLINHTNIAECLREKESAVTTSNR